MKNNVLPNQEHALGSDQILKVTALLYLKEALVAQAYESCPELIDTAKKLGIASGDISAVIADYLSDKGAGASGRKVNNLGRQSQSRLRP